MRVEYHDGFGKATNESASRVVVYDNYGNPIAVVVEVETGHHVAATAANKNFNKILEAMGITRTVVVDHIDPKRLPKLEVK